MKVKLLSYLLFKLRRFGIALRSWKPRWLVDVFLRGPNKKLSKVSLP